jgi:diguanylate cyclase (GGDEF)-like protein
MPPAFPIPENETDRLERLRQYHILDTPPSEAFDRVTRLASRLLKMPVALVSLIDEDRQWFKSKIGIEADETPRDVAFCAHAICQSTALVVPDAQRDPRFADNPLVTGTPFVRFYAGVPLRSPDGHNVGTLCVIDHVVRELSAEDSLLLNDLAQIVVDELELHAVASQDQEARRRLINAIEAAPDGFVFFDRDDRLAVCNNRYRELFPESADLLVPGTPFETIVRGAVARRQFPDAVGNEEAWIQMRLDFHRNPDRAMEQKLPDGRWVRVEERRTPDGETVGFRTDITGLKKRERVLADLAVREQQARDRLFDAIEALPDGFVYYDADDKLLLCNQRYREMYPQSAELMKEGASFEEVIRGGVANGQYPAAIGREEAWIQKRLEIHRNAEGPLEQELPDGRWIRIVERRTSDGGLVGFRTDITELKRREFALELLATTDSLTGALNRRRFMEDGDKELRRARRYGAPVAVLLVDIDYFKRINDSHGHAIGDEVLRRLVAEMFETLREHDLICRYGGEEFAVLFPETDAAAGEVAAERLRVAIEQMQVPTEKGNVCPTVSIGGTQIDVHNDSLESALSRADSALYEAKEKGRNQVCFRRATCAALKAVL